MGCNQSRAKFKFQRAYGPAGQSRVPNRNKASLATFRGHRDDGATVKLHARSEVTKREVRAVEIWVRWGLAPAALKFPSGADPFHF